MGDELEQPGTGEIIIPPTPPAGDPNPENTVEFWRNRYNGQQGAVTRISNEKKTAQEQTRTLSEQYEAEKATLTQRIQDFEAQTKTLTTEKTQFETQFVALNKQVELGKMIHKDYPELSLMWDQGLLLGAETLADEALTEYLTNQKAFVESLRKGGVQDYHRGSAPPPPPNPGTVGMSFEEIQTKLMTTSPLDPEYKPLEKMYLDLVRKQKT